LGPGEAFGVPDIRRNDGDLAGIANFPVSDLEVVDNSALEVSDQRSDAALRDAGHTAEWRGWHGVQCIDR
jgi:hypothetical protein